MLYKNIVVKIGTAVITDAKGFLNEAVIGHIVDQLALIKKKGASIAVISSGAVGAGKSLVNASHIQDKIIRRQLLASVGQIPLINTYTNLFKRHGHTCAQILATKEDFRDRLHYLNMKNCLAAMLNENIVPIINENDVISVTEMMFSDNDELAGLIAAMIGSEALIIATSVDGVYDKNPDDPTARILKEINPQTFTIKQCIVSQTSKGGKGGMATKCQTAFKLSSLGITTHIINGAQNNALIDLMEGKSVGTKAVPHETASSVKRWIANSEGYERGIVFVNECAMTTLKDHTQAKSLLPVGIIKIEGEFQKGDIIKINGPHGEEIGYGKASCDSKQASQRIGQNRAKPLVHYDYLYIKS